VQSTSPEKGFEGTEEEDEFLSLRRSPLQIATADPDMALLSTSAAGDSFRKTQGPDGKYRSWRRWRPSKGRGLAESAIHRQC